MEKGKDGETSTAVTENSGNTRSTGIISKTTKVTNKVIPSGARQFHLLPTIVLAYLPRAVLRVFIAINFFVFTIELLSKFSFTHGQVKGKNLSLLLNTLFIIGNTEPIVALSGPV